MQRTHHLHALTNVATGKSVILQGWIHRIRNHGQLTFLDLRDQYGLVQIVVKSEQAKNLKLETVIEVHGTVRPRLRINEKLPTGKIEIETNKIKVISEAKTLPFIIDDELHANEETRLKYRYLDLRRPLMKQRILDRAQINQVIRKSLADQEFIEVETPFLTRSTPEGARDFLVASRLKPKNFYALPQSPQLLKQLLMVSGFDRYFQIVRSFRDEDLRLDRQPEFTQLDLEMAFAKPEDVMESIEKLMKSIFKTVKGTKITLPLKRMTYEEAIQTYGTDKPDLRFDLPLMDLKELLSANDSGFFGGHQLQNFTAKAIIVPQLLTKKQLSLVEEASRQHHLKKFSFLKYQDDNWSGPLASHLSDNEKKALKNKIINKKGSTILIGHGASAEVLPALGAMRKELGKLLNLIKENHFELLWITDFPLFEWSEEEKRYVSAHNPFTMPHHDSLADFDRDFTNSKAQSFDLVINGYEIGSGARRITDPKLQERMFKALRLSKEEVENNFGWFVNAYHYGAPYHSGIGLGLDRLAMILSNASSIREVIAFPKNATGHDLMMETPSPINEQQLSDLGLKITK